MNLYLISQNQNQNYDTYDSAVVCANNEEQARNMSPRNRDEGSQYDFRQDYSPWCESPSYVEVQLIGKAAPSIKIGVVCASFNAG